MAKHLKLVDDQFGVVPSEIEDPLLLRALRYRDLARDARQATMQINEEVRDPFILVATQWERLAREIESGTKEYLAVPAILQNLPAIRPDVDAA
jgi:hypothetical protein